MALDLSGFSKLSYDARLARLAALKLITNDQLEWITGGGLRDMELGDKLIENALGYFQIPLGIATHFRIDDQDRLIPMAVEETSIIAAASRTAKWIREYGKIETEIIGQEIIGQIQIAKLEDVLRFETALLNNSLKWIAEANEKVAHGLVRRGGGVRSLTLRKLVRPDGKVMGVIHVLMDPVDAMGANIINQVCEYLKPLIEEVTSERVTMCILSNLVNTRLTKVSIELETEDSDLAEKISEASLFAELDPYRAATNNKGVMNGMDPILLATGNDWRAVEAGVHAYACRTGAYRSITRWSNQGRVLTGQLVAPVIVGTVGGVTRLHPMARISMDLLKVQSAAELSRVVGAVGLVQNLGALRALTTVGIIEGHMKLHLKNLALAAEALPHELGELREKLERILLRDKRVSQQDAVEELARMRNRNRGRELHGTAT